MAISRPPSFFSAAVFAHDVAVIPAGVCQPIPVKIQLVVEQAAVQRAKAAKGIGGKQDLLAFFISHHHFGPMDHGGGVEPQGVGAQLQGLPFFDHDRAVGQVHIVKLLHQAKGLGIAHHLHLGVPQHQLFDVGAVVRLHVVDHQIVQAAACQGMLNVFQELPPNGGIHRIHHSGLIVQDQIGIVGHPPRDGKQVLKQRQTPVAAADPDDMVGDLPCAMHGNCSSLFQKIVPHCYLTRRGHGSSAFFSVMIIRHLLPFFQHRFTKRSAVRRGGQP